MNAHVGTRMLRGLIGAVAVAALTIPVAAAAGPGDGGGGGGPGGGGGGTGEDTTGSLYSELVLALRAENGSPILKKYVVPATLEVPEETIEYCVQPISYTAVAGIPASVNPVDGRTVWVIPLQGEWIGDPGPLPVEEIEPCDPMPQYAMFVKEAELERLNLTRTADDVIAQKVADVALKLRYADAIALESTGRIAYDDAVIDASPENAGMYQSLMTSGTIPGLPVSPTTSPAPPAEVGPVPADATSNSRFDAWELAAMTIGAAASKSVPLSIDAVEYYNRVIGFPPPADPTAVPPVPDYTSPWGVDFVTSADPDPIDTLSMDGSERFVDYSGFTYNRSQTFKGSVTWLDVATLTWKVDKITNQVPFTNLSSYAQIGTNTLSGVTAFAQMADDVRAMCNFVPDNTFLPGFSMDVPGVDTTDAQLSAIHDPAVDLGTLPENVFQTFPFEMTASLLNPWGGTLVDEAQLLITIDAETPFAADTDVTATTTNLGAIPFAVDSNGDLVGRWGPDTGFPVAPGYNVSTTFNVVVADGAPLGAYTVTLALVDVDDPATILAQEIGTITVNANLPTVMWGDILPKYVTQGVAMTLPVEVYSPAAATGELTLTVTGPGDDPLTDVTEATAAGDVKVYASDGVDMVNMPLTLTDGKLVGTWDTALTAGYTDVTWYVTVAEGALVGNYAFGVSLTGGTTLQPDPILVVVFAPDTHGEIPPDAGEDTIAPVVTLAPVVTVGDDATLTFTANEDLVDFACMLTTNGTAGEWEACTSPTTYSNLVPADYVFSVKGTDKALNTSVPVTQSWTVDPAADITPPVVTVMPKEGTTPGATATFDLSANETGVTFECRLTKNRTVTEEWAPCTSPKEYTGLVAAKYILSVRGTDAAGNTSDVKTVTWTVRKVSAK